MSSQPTPAAANEPDPCTTLDPVSPPGSGSDPTAPDLSALERFTGKSPPSFIEAFKAVVEQTPENATDGTPESKRRNGRAAAAVMGYFLLHHPDAMFDELRGRGLAAFRPQYGPVLVVSGDAVREVFRGHDKFTVDPYGVEMARVIHSPALDGSGRVHNFVLGTDEDHHHCGDREILERAVNADDPRWLRNHIAAVCRRQVENAVVAARRSKGYRLDVVTQLARVVPLDLVESYMGLTLLERNGRFELTDKMHGMYGKDIVVEEDGKKLPLADTGLGREDGILPDAATMYCWIKTAYECFFNNVPRDINVRRQGFRSSRLLLCAIQQELTERKARMIEGADVAPLGEQPAPGQVPDGLLTRLVQYRMDGSAEPDRVTDLRIAENLLGTTLGIMVGLEEAIARVIDALIKLREGGHYQPCAIPGMEASYEDAREQAQIALSASSSEEEKLAARERLTLYFREGLRLEPQAEILLRQCKETGTLLLKEPVSVDPELVLYARNKPLNAKDLLFVAHRSAMRDLDGPYEFRLGRPDPDSTYLFQGYGRHKCLGQYMAPVAAVEAMIAVLALDGLQRLGPLEMDKKGLYARAFPVAFRDSPITRMTYP